MHNVVVAFYAFAGVKLAGYIGSMLSFNLVPKAVLVWQGQASLIASLALPRLLIALLLGSLLALLRPTASFKAVAAGLILYIATPALALWDNAPLYLIGLACATETLLALCFAIPIAVTSGLVTSRGDGLVFGSTALMLVPLTIMFFANNVTVGPMPRSPEPTPTTAGLPSFRRLGQSGTGPTFEDSLAQAIKEGRIPLDPKFQAMRDAILSNSAVLRSNPCDAIARSRIRVATLAYWSNFDAFERPNVEWFTVGDRSEQVTITLNRPSMQIVGEVMRAEIVTVSDLPRLFQRAMNMTHDLDWLKPNLASPFRCRQQPT